MNVGVTKPARWMISHRGGELWVWAASLGAEAMIRTSTKAHRDREFDRVELDGVVVWFEQGMALDHVSIGWTPFTGFDVTWPGTLLMPKAGSGGGN